MINIDDGSLIELDMFDIITGSFVSISLCDFIFAVLKHDQ